MRKKDDQLKQKLWSSAVSSVLGLLDWRCRQCWTWLLMVVCWPHHCRWSRWCRWWCRLAGTTTALYLHCHISNLTISPGCGVRELSTIFISMLFAVLLCCFVIAVMWYAEDTSLSWFRSSFSCSYASGFFSAEVFWRRLLMSGDQ